MSASLTESYFKERVSKGSKSAFLKVMSKVLDIKPNDRDKLP